MNETREIQQQFGAVFLYFTPASISSSESFLTLRWSIVSFMHTEPK